MNVLAYTSPARGHLYPLMPVLLELAARGATVHVRTLAGAVDEVRVAGLHAESIDPAIEQIELDDHLARTPLGALRRTFAAWGRRAELEIADLVDAIAQTRPDILMIDTTTFGARAAAEASGIPWLESRPFFLDDPVPGQPPFGLGLHPKAGPVGAVRDLTARRVVASVERRLQLPVINAARHAAGLPPVPTMQAARHRGARTIAFTAPPFDHARPAHAKVVFVGPCAWDQRALPSLTLPALDGRPVALISCSSEFQGDTAIATAAIDGLADSHQVIVTAPGIDPAAIPTRSGASVHRLLPHAPLLANAAVVVCHGGMGITQRALAHSVPVVVVPWGRDQLDVAVSVQRTGSGLVVARRRCTAARLARAVDAIEPCRPAAARIGAAFAAAGGPSLAADVVAAATSAARPASG